MNLFVLLFNVLLISFPSFVPYHSSAAFTNGERLHFVSLLFIIFEIFFDTHLLLLFCRIHMS